MAFYSNVEPFEESQGNVRDAPTSPDILKAYYKDMEKKEKEAALERKTSKRKSHSIFNRKSIKRASAAPSDQQRPPQRPGEKSPHPDDERGEMEKLEQKEKSDIISGLPSRSIVPEVLKELPTWFNKEDWSPTTSYRIKYPIHNPVGPRYYRNYHLIPPSEYRPNARPPSVFSPSFPAMTSSFDRSEDTTRLPGPSRTPSNSPLPTPSSSQTRVADAGLKPRSRKTSHDGVDLMDVSDPWGTNWHHQSPYDVGIGHNTFSGEVHDSTNHPHIRSRRSSLTTRENRSKTVIPSPLSQSMSAIHLAPQSENGARIPRKLSKRRAPIFGGWFNGNPKGSDTHSLAHSESNSPTYGYGEVQRSASAFAALPPGKSDRRRSVLGRLAKRFSVVRKPPSGIAQQNASEEIPVSRQPSPEKQKRVPAPSVDEPLQPPSNPEPESDRRSSISVEAPYTIGKLMVANPDAPASETNTPLPETTSLPRNHSPTENSKIVQSPVSVHAPSSPQITLSPTSPISNNLFTERRSLDDKPLPRPVVERKPVEKNMAVSPPPPAVSKALAPPDVSDIGPPPPSATTKPITLPDLSNPPPPPSVTTKPIPLPITANPLPAPPVVMASPISLPDEPPIPPSSTTKPVPLPSSSLPIPFPVEESTSRHSHLTVTDSGIDYSPLSAISMLVNPPTPHRADDMPMPSGSGSTPAPLPQSHPQSQSQLQQPVIHKRASSNHSKRSREGKRDPSPGISSVKARETETFKLVRSKSGNVYASNETIKAGGEQWEVVENVQEKEGRSKSRSVSSTSAHRDKESREKEGKESRESKRESRRQEKEREREREKERGKEMEREKQREKEESETAKQSSRSSRKHQSIEKHSHGQSSSDNPAEVGYKDEARSSRSRRSHDDDTYRERDRRERKSSRRTTQSASPDKKQAQAHAAAKASASASSPSAPNESTSVSRASLDRRPSTSARPTSEVPLVADLNAMRAKEAWEMERLYKARSLYGMDPNDNGAAPPVVGPSPPVIDTKHASASDPTLNRSGSLSKGLHGSSHTSFMVSSPFSSNSAHQIYSSPPTIPSEASFSSPELLPLPVSHNPLPAPPRDVTTEYWTFANTGTAASH